MKTREEFLKEHEKLSKEEMEEVMYQQYVENAKLQEDNAKLNKDNEKLIEVNNNLTRRLFGRKTEKISPNQLSLFNEAEETVDISSIEELKEPEEIISKKKKKKPKNANLHNLRIVEEHRYPETTTCDTCGSSMKELKPETKEYLVYKPAQYYIQRVINHVFVCQKCSAETMGFVTKKNDLTDLPARVIDGSVVTSTFIAHIVMQKFKAGVPFYRQAQLLQLQGAEISRQNLCNWVLKAGEMYLEPLFRRMEADARKMDVIHMDETTLSVIENKEDRDKSYTWLLMSGKWEKKQMALYYYFPDRRHTHVYDILSDEFHGIIQSDAYEAYPNYIHAKMNVFCMAHARREYFESLDSDLYAKYKKASKEEKKEILAGAPRLRYALKMIAYITELSNIEKELTEKKAKPKEIYTTRQEKAVPILNTMHELALEIKASFSGGSKFYEANEYFLNQWEGLFNYVRDGRTSLTNNLAEREGIKPYVIARKNFLFAGTERGATISAQYFSLMISAVMNHLNPEEYIAYVLETLAKKGMKDEIVESLLPYSNQLPSSLYIKEH